MECSSFLFFIFFKFLLVILCSTFSNATITWNSFAFWQIFLLEICADYFKQYYQFCIIFAVNNGWYMKSAFKSAQIAPIGHVLQKHIFHYRITSSCSCARCFFFSPSLSDFLSLFLFVCCAVCLAVSCTVRRTHFSMKFIINFECFRQKSRVSE